MMFSFVQPTYLFGLFLIPLLIFLHFYNLRNVKGRSLRFANFDAIARVKGIDIYSKNIMVLILNILLVFSLVFLLSGLTLHTELDTSAFSFVIAIDSSESMGATDMNPDRLTVAKKTSTDFVDSLPYGSRAGVVSFSGNTFVEQELTSNKEFLKSAFENIELTEFGGTDIYEAVSISLSLLKEEDQKAIILLSDGQINVGNIYATVEYAKENNVVIHTFGVGTLEGGNVSYGLSKLDEESLKSLAYNTNGHFFKISSEEDMKKAFGEVIPLTRKNVSIDLSFYLIILTIILFIVQQFLMNLYRISI